MRKKRMSELWWIDLELACLALACCAMIIAGLVFG